MVPDLPSGRTRHAAFEGMLAIPGAGDALVALTDYRDIGRYAARVITDAVGMPHPVAQPPVVSTGLDLEDDAAADEALVAGEVLSLRAGVHDRNGAAIVSAMLVVQEQGSEILWQSP